MEDREIELLQDGDSKAMRDLRRQLAEKDAEIERLRSVIDELDPTGLRRIK